MTSQQVTPKDTVELMFRLNQKSTSLHHFNAMWSGKAPLKVPPGFIYRGDEIGQRSEEEQANISTSHQQGNVLLPPEPKTDAKSLLLDLADCGLALVEQNLYLQEDQSTDGENIRNLKLIARYTFKSRDRLFEDEREIDEEDVRVWVDNLFALTLPFLWKVAVYRNPTSEDRFKTHINFRERSDRPKPLPGVKYAPNLLRLEQGAFVLKAA